MQGLAAYQSGLWLAEYINLRCQLCHVYRSTPQALASWQSNNLSHTHNSTQAFLSRLHHRFNKGLLCARCHDSIVWRPTPFTVDIAASTSLPIQAATYYDYPIRQVIRAFKHHEDMTKLPLLVHVMRQLPRPVGCHSSNSVILPMPTTTGRLVKRGFDPVTILSFYLSKYWQIPLWYGVQRVDDTLSQQGLSRAERLTNLDNAFMLSELPPVKRILLFDDVATTGASLQALARAFYEQSSPAFSGSQDNTLHSKRYHLSAYAVAHGSMDK